jgi:hypothetical protein
MRTALGVSLFMFALVFESSSQAQTVDDLRKSASDGNPIAESQLSERFESGDGVEKDAKKAFCWVHRSAEHGFPKAWLNIGIIYSMGRGVQKDDIESYKWLYMLNSIPENAKDSEISKWGKEDAARITRQMTPAQIREAKGRADQWWKAVAARGHAKPGQMYVPYPGDRPSC